MRLPLGADLRNVFNQGGKVLVVVHLVDLGRGETERRGEESLPRGKLTSQTEDAGSGGGGLGWNSSECLGKGAVERPCVGAGL